MVGSKNIPSLLLLLLLSVAVPNMYVQQPLIQGVPGGKDLTSGECSLGQTIPI
jgi:hypothetical protein